MEKVKSQMLKARREGGQRLERLERQCALLLSQAEDLESSEIPRIERRSSDAVAEEYRAMEALREVAEGGEAEAAMVAALAAHARERAARAKLPCAAEKEAALLALERLQSVEREQLEEERARRMGNIEQLRAKREADVAVAREKIRILGEAFPIISFFSGKPFQISCRRERGRPPASSPRAGG